MMTVQVYKGNDFLTQFDNFAATPIIGSLACIPRAIAAVAFLALGILSLIPAIISEKARNFTTASFTASWLTFIDTIGDLFLGAYHHWIAGGSDSKSPATEAWNAFKEGWAPQQSYTQ